MATSKEKHTLHVNNINNPMMTNQQTKSSDFFDINKQNRGREKISEKMVPFFKKEQGIERAEGDFTRKSLNMNNQMGIGIET